MNGRTISGSSSSGMTAAQAGSTADAAGSSGSTAGIQTFEVRVAGVPLKLRATHDERTVRELVALVDTKVSQALASNSNISYQKALLLAALHIAEDLVFLKRAAAERLDQLEIKARAIVSDLNSSPLTHIEIQP